MLQNLTVTERLAILIVVTQVTVVGAGVNKDRTHIVHHVRKILPLDGKASALNVSRNLLAHLRFVLEVSRIILNESRSVYAVCGIHPL